jgi:hypothetical protein
MNDPRVVSLYYEVITSPDVSFKAPPLDHSTPEFDLHLAEGQAIFTLKGHHASVEDARKIVEPFVTAWTISSGLAASPEHFQLKFDRAKTNRAPYGSYKVTGMPVSLHHGRREYPPLPQNFSTSPLVESMYYQWEGYKAGHMTLATVAYFCLTLLEGFGEKKREKKKRLRAASEFYIDQPVLARIGCLTANKGGREARKVEGIDAEFSAEERFWLEEVTKRLIIRAGEKAASPTATLPQITMDELRQL